MVKSCLAGERVADEGMAERVLRLFKGWIGTSAPSGPRLDRLPFSLHLIVGTSAVELFPSGPLDVLRFFQRHHASVRHELEYVACRPAGAGPEDFRPFALFRLRPEEKLELLDPSEIERRLRRGYGTLVDLPRARPLLERQYSSDLNDEDPPEGANRPRSPAGEKPVPGKFSTGDVLELIRKELGGPEAISWLEGAFRQPPRTGRVEHRYYLDAGARVYLVRDHFSEGKTLYRAETSETAPRSERP